MKVYNVYCDESCHLENDNQKTMVIGGIWCEIEVVSEINDRIRDIKKDNNFNPYAEVKWVKVSPANLDLYIALINYFFDNSDLHFRGIVIPDKSILKHEVYFQTHDDFYYKMYFTMLKQIWEPHSQYNIYLDIKDTEGYKKIENLKTISQNANYDFSGNLIRKMQQIRSHESEILQITDLIIGSLSYLHRGCQTSKAKLEIISKIKNRLYDIGRSYSLLRNSYLSEKKFNILIWKGRRSGDDEC
ncbi:MAG: DUF3800 domain-containing protein [Candidatus Stygibacter frigidus]|nr:DUF3800 domain-containing protein [Candidatus Stygibacter frigidus]